MVVGKPLLAYAIENKLDALIDAILVRSDLNINETFDQTFYHQDDPDPTIVRISLLSYALINKADKVIKLLLQNPDLIIHSNDNCMSVFRYLKQDPDIKPSEHLIQGLIINSSTHILRNNTDYLIKVNFNWTTKFDNGETILHLLVKKSFGPTLFKPILVYVHYLLQHNTPSNEPLVKVNLRDNNGNRAIDLLGNSHNEFITLLRNHGSVEPKEPIGDPSFKLILDDGSGYAPDGIPGNKAKAEKILQLMFGKYALTDQEINDEIIEFKKNPELLTIKAEWGGVINNVLQVIDELSTMNDEHDRLSVSWDFKKVLGILIHITKNDDDAPNLIYTLSQIKMCSLSKLINLLAVGQDKIIASIETDYSKKTLESFDDILEKVLDAVLSSLGNKAPLALIKWKNDLINKASINDPEQWCGYTQKIHGICNKIFSEHAEGVTNASYHFTDGLKSKIIEPLCWKLVSEGPATTIVEAWRNIIKQGASLLAMELFDKIVNGEKPVNSIEQAIYEYPLSFGDLPLLDVSTIKHYYELINQKYGEKEANQFAHFLQECFLNDKAVEYLKSIFENPSQDEKVSESVQYAQSPNHDYSVDIHGDITDC